MTEGPGGRKGRNQLSKHIKYLKYVLRHKWFTFLASTKIKGASCWLAIIHDLSKFRPSEWVAYCRYFYGGPYRSYADFPSGLKYEFDCWRISQEFIGQEFDVAWLKHQHRNPHHWQHWILREDNGGTKIMQMPCKYIKEMVADWMGAGRAITGRWEVGEWYEKNKEKILLHPNTRTYVEDILNHVK